MDDFLGVAFLGVVAIAFVTFQAAKVLGRVYEARTARLRATSDTFHVAAARVLGHAAVDLPSLRLLERLNDVAWDGDQAWALVRVRHVAPLACVRIPPPIVHDLATASGAALSLICEMRPIPGAVLRRRLASLRTRSGDEAFVEAIRTWTACASPGGAARNRRWARHAPPVTRRGP